MHGRSASGGHAAAAAADVHFTAHHSINFNTQCAEVTHVCHSEDTPFWTTDMSAFWWIYVFNTLRNYHMRNNTLFGT